MKTTSAKFPSQCNTNELKSQFTAACRQAKGMVKTDQHAYVFFVVGVKNAIKAFSKTDMIEHIGLEGGKDLTVRLADFHA